MDQLKDSVGLRGYAERDPRIEYKREGANHFQQMHKSVRDRVTELIFRARLTPNVQARSAYSQQQQAQHAEAQSATAGAGTPAAAGAASSRDAATASAAAGTADQQADQQAADQAGGGDGPRERPVSRKQRRAREARQRKETGAGHKQRKKKSR